MLAGRRTARTQAVRADIVIGADGLRSTRRRGSSEAPRHAPGPPRQRDRLRLLVGARARRLPLVLRAAARRRAPSRRTTACVLLFVGVLRARFAGTAVATSSGALPPRARARSPPTSRSGWRAPARSAACTASPASPGTCAARGAQAGRSSATPATSRTRSPRTASATRCATPSCSAGAVVARRRRRARRLRADARCSLERLFEVTDRVASRREWDTAETQEPAPPA